jgi:hypothetical protein
MKGRRALVTGVLLTGVGLLAVYGYNVERNLRARRTLETACREVREARDTLLPEELVRTLFEYDAPFVLGAIRESIERPCVETDARLAFWRWNLGVSYALPREPARAARLGAALERARLRCPELMMQAFRELPGHVEPARSASMARETCAPFGPLAQRLSVVPSERLTAWQWADRIASVARALQPPPRAHRRR